MFLLVNGTRFIIVVPVYYMLTCCCKRDLKFKELVFMCYSGALKGAICYGLLAEMSDFGVWCPYDPKETIEGQGYPKYYPLSNDCEEKKVIHNSILAVVILTTVIFGTFLGPVRKCLLGAHGERKDLEEDGKIKTWEDIIADHDIV
jgi:hypothetical protein